MDADYTRQMAAIQKDHWWYEGRRNVLARLIKTIKLPPRSNILEAGCGPGANLEMLSCFGALSAFEPDAFSAAHAAQISGAIIKKGGLPDNIPYEQNFDLVCAFDVIEHIEDESGALKALKSRIKPDGHAIFTVPAHQWLWSAHDEINHHKRRYSRAGFKTALEQAGFEVIKISYYNMWLFPAAALVRLIKNILGAKEELKSDVHMPPPALNKILCALFSSEKYLLPSINLPFGLSVVAICKVRGG